jgi:hypothetical protein
VWFNRSLVFQKPLTLYYSSVCFILHHVQYWIGGLMCSLGTCQVPYLGFWNNLYYNLKVKLKSRCRVAWKRGLPRACLMHHRRLSRCVNVSCMKNQNQQERGLHVFGRVCFMYWYALSTNRNLITILLDTWPSKFWISHALSNVHVCMTSLLYSTMYSRIFRIL